MLEGRTTLSDRSDRDEPGHLSQISKIAILMLITQTERTQSYEAERKHTDWIIISIGDSTSKPDEWPRVSSLTRAQVC